MFVRLRSKLYSDKGENSLLVIISQQVSLIIMAALAGLMFILITGGVKIQGENNSQTELRIANRAFINDVQNAKTVYAQDDTKITLSSTDFLKNASGQYVCRASSWYIAPASTAVKQARGDTTLMAVYNDISVYPTVDCSTGTPSTQHRTAVSSVAADATFKFTNIAGVKLQFSNGIATTFAGLDVASTAPADVAKINAFRATNSVETWYTNDEMVRELPKVIELHLNAVMPITESNSATFKATTDQQETELIGNNNNITDPGGEQTRWVPNPVSTPIVSRSTTTGAVTGGQIEGLHIQWAPRPAAECSPTQTLTYSWLVTNLRTNKHSSGETTTASVDMTTGIGGNAEIWNGGNYKVQIAGRCNDIDGQSGDASALYTLPLPGVLNFVVMPNASETTHTLTWTKVSSDPTLTYSIQASPAISAKASSYTKQTVTDTIPGGLVLGTAWVYPNMPWTTISGSPTAQTTINTTGNIPVPGYPDSYQVRASTTDSPNTTGIWTPANYIYKAGAPAAAKITSVSPTRFDWSTPTCAASTTQQYEAGMTNSLGSNGSAPIDGTTRSLLDSNGIQTMTGYTYAAVNQGTRIYVRVITRCTTPFTLSPTNGEDTATLSPFNAPVSNIPATPPLGSDYVAGQSVYPSAVTSALGTSSAYYKPNLGAEYVDWTPNAPVAPMPTANYPGYGNNTGNTIAWSVTNCGAGTSLTYHAWYTAGAGGDSGWFAGTSWASGDGRLAPGTYYTYSVQAECSSGATGQILNGVSGVNTGGYYTLVGSAGVPAITRSASSVVVGGSAVVYASPGGCPAQTSWVWTSNPAGTKSYGSPGTRYWNGSGYCVGANSQSGSGASDSTNITWYTPAPAVPSPGSTPTWQWNQPNGNTTYQVVLATVGAVNWASSYGANVEFNWTSAGGIPQVTSSRAFNDFGTFNATFGIPSGASPTSARIQFQASGAGGSSVWSGWYNCVRVLGQ